MMLLGTLIFTQKSSVPHLEKREWGRNFLGNYNGEGVSIFMLATILLVVGVSSVITSTILIYSCCVIESRYEQLDEDSLIVENAIVQEYSSKQGSDVAYSVSKRLKGCVTP